MYPITTVVRIIYKEGLYNECLQWMQETASTASEFEGFMGKEIFSSTETERQLINIFTFRDSRCIQVWENSEERILQIKKGENFIEEIKSKTQMTGIEFMFPIARTPKRLKMLTITICVVFILLNSLVPFISQLLTLLHFPILLKSFLGVVMMVSLMTFLILPFLSKILGQWLVS